MIKSLRHRIFIVFFFIGVANSFADEPISSVGESFIWKEHSIVPPAPGHHVQKGMAGVFSGIVDGKLIIAGGANFPDKLPWDGGIKTWWDDIYVYDTRAASPRWEVHHQKLPFPIGYGVSINLPEGLLCIGGGDDKRSYSDVFLIRWNDGRLEFDEWPSLPVPLAYSAGALVDGRIYIAGGEDYSNPGATSYFFVLDTRAREKGWIQLNPWPGPPRSFAVAAAQSDGFDYCFYLFSGRNYGPYKPLDVLVDGYEYNPRTNSWRRLDSDSGPEFPVMAGTAVASGTNHILLFGGSDGKLMLEQSMLQQKLSKLRYEDSKNDSILILENRIRVMLDRHPGFSSDIRVYHTITNTIYSHSRSPYLLPVTTNIFRHNNEIIITSGETKPGIRNPQVLSVQIQNPVRAFGIINSMVIFLYFSLLVGMGWYFSKRQKNANDYFKGGGRLPWWAVGLSIFGTALSAITFMAIPAKSYATDWSYILMNAGIVLVAPIIILLFIPFYRKLNVTTAYEYLEQRFNLATRLICSLAFIVFQIGRMGIVLFLPAIALNVVTGMDIFLCIGLMGVLSLVYTMMGGIEAVVWTDALQVVILLGGAILAIFYIGSDIQGGLPAVFSQAASDGKFELGSTAVDFKNPAIWTVLIASIFTNLTTYGADQTMVQRYLTTKNEKMARQSVWTNAVLVIPASLIFFFVGTALYVFYKEHPEILSITNTEGDAVFPSFIFNRMPAGVVGLLISGIFAAAMSTLSSSMNSAATAWSVDFHFRFGWSKNMDKLLLARITTLILGIMGIAFAVMMATWNVKSLWDEFQKILGLVLGGLGGLFLLGILTRRANGKGALIGILGSMLVQIWVNNTQAVHLLLYATTGFVSCFILGYVASLLVPGDRKDIEHLTIYGREKTSEKYAKYG
jgi:solute:Na+ symporter, SSS family